MMVSVPPVHATARHSLIPRWLTQFGALGLFALAILDSSVIPLPIPGSADLLLLWLVSHHGDPPLLVLSATAGSVIGGYTAWASGKRGGEAALKRYGQSAFFARVSKWVEQHSILSVFVPALLPPPVPMSMFLIAAGALGISCKRFLLAFSAGRIIRYTLVAWLAVAYGRRIVRVWSGTLDKWSAPLLWVFISFLTCGIAYGIWQFRRNGTPALDTRT
jgi:membrane protein YqaA with SNARE-associated domain